MNIGYLSRYQRWYSKPENKEKRKAQMRLYYYLNKDGWNDKRKAPKKSKGQKEFREKRAKCVYYLKTKRGWSYRQIANRLSICDPKNVWKILKRYERNRNEKANQL